MYWFYGDVVYFLYVDGGDLLIYVVIYQLMDSVTRKDSRLGKTHSLLTQRLRLANIYYYVGIYFAKTIIYKKENTTFIPIQFRIALPTVELFRRVSLTLPFSKSSHGAVAPIPVFRSGVGWPDHVFKYHKTSLKLMRWVRYF